MTAGPKALSQTDFGTLKGVNLADGSASTDAATKGQVDVAQAYGASLANRGSTTTDHTAISDFDTQVRTSRLDQMAAPTADVGLNSRKITSLAAGVNPTDAAQWGQVQDLLSGARKADVVGVTTTNHGLTGLVAFDGVTPVAGNRVLVTGQTLPGANGIYTAASGAWARATDADAAAEFATTWLVTSTGGTVNADTLWTFASPGTITLGTTAIQFVKIGPISGGSGAQGFTTTCPAVSAGATWTVNHGLTSRNVIAQVYRVASPYDLVNVRIERDAANLTQNVLVKPDIAMTSGEYEIMIMKVA